MKTSLILSFIKNAKVLAGAFLPILLLTPVAFAQTTTWNGNGDGTTWSDVDNWTDGLPTSQGRFGNSPPDAPVSINVDSPQTFRNANFINLGDRSYTFSGAAITLQHTGSDAAAINTSFTGDKSPITFNTDLIIAHIDPALASTLTLSGTYTTMTLNGDLLTSGTGNRQVTFNFSTGSLIVNGANEVGFLSFGGVAGTEIVAGSSNALGIGYVQKTNAATLSLRSDVVVTGDGNTYAWLQSSANSYTPFRISELSPSSVDRTLTLEDRIAGSNGAIEWIDNINSTGRLILELGYSGGNAQPLPLIPNTTGIVRFTQTGNTTYSGLISGDGSVEVTGGGNTTFTAANSYAGTTTVTNGSLIISASGTIEGTSELQLGATGSFNLSGITPASYTFGPGQTLSGTGTVVAGGKDVIMQGTLSPGNSAGTLTFDLGAAGTLVLEDTVQLHFELGTVSDLILLSSGTLDIGSGELEFANFVFTELAGFGQGQYTLFETGENILGTLGSSTSGAIGAYTGELSIQGTDLVLTVIPEPKMLWLALFAAIPVLLRQLRNRC